MSRLMNSYRSSVCCSANLVTGNRMGMREQQISCGRVDVGAIRRSARDCLAGDWSIPAIHRRAAFRGMAAATFPANRGVSEEP